MAGALPEAENRGRMMSPWIVLKFGGTSVSSRERWDTIVAQARRQAESGRRALIVCSALSGISDLLDSLVTRAAAGDGTASLEEIRRRHLALARSLAVDCDLLCEELSLLERLATGISLTRELSPRLKAQVMACGELMSTRLGAAYLERCGLPTRWWDARSLLTATPSPGPAEQAYLSAVCGWEADSELRERLNGEAATIHLTQGFIAATAEGDTVLLGRGGSDTSAAYLAARMGAECCEIWTDVPGMYTADPRRVPQARMLRRLSYDEAQELASVGAKVLHPRCLAPLKANQIPLQIRCTQAPELEGTRIAAGFSEDLGRVKAVSSKSNITLISMDGLDMWQQVGFLADVFACFKSQGFSVDLVATSETNVTVSLDGAANLATPERMARLLQRLGEHCRPRTITPCAGISLVGTRIRSILHRLAPVLELFEEEEVHLVSQASSDLNLTFVVDQDQADKLVANLHSLLFSGGGDADMLGPTWQEQFTTGLPVDTDSGRPWWAEHRESLLAEAERGTPVYVYHKPSLEQAARQLLELQSIDRVFYAIKANPHPGILCTFGALGLGFECVSPGELERVRETVGPLERGRLLYTPNFASREDYEAGFAAGAQVTLDNLAPLEQWPDLFRGRELFLRLDPGRGGGHHRHVRTGGPQSKFGISRDQLDKLQPLLEALEVKITGLHAHRGSGILEPDAWARTGTYLASIAERFPGVEVLDMGGGLGVSERWGARTLDLAELDCNLLKFRTAHPGYRLWLEPGRYLVAWAGALLARVTQTKRKGDKHFVGLDAGMHSLIRPALYGSYHEIRNLTRLEQPDTLSADVVGPICETGDVLGHDRRLPPTLAGDYLVVSTTGAYGRAMSSEYNLRGLPRELMFEPSF